MCFKHVYGKTSVREYQSDFNPMLALCWLNITTYYAYYYAGIFYRGLNIMFAETSHRLLKIISLPNQQNRRVDIIILILSVLHMP